MASYPDNPRIAALLLNQQAALNASAAMLRSLREHVDADHAALRRVWQVVERWESAVDAMAGFTDPRARADRGALRGCAAEVRKAVTGDA